MVESVFPGKHWEKKTPEEVGVRSDILKAISDKINANGVVVRHGYLIHEFGNPSLTEDLASSVKPIISMLLMIAIQEGRIESPDSYVADFEPELLKINGGKDSTITWRQLASQTSGYALPYKPGEIFAYNDYALSLYVRTLYNKVFGESDMNAPIKKYFAEPLEFEDKVKVLNEGKIGRTYMSARDYARIGVMALAGGMWKDKRIIDEKLLKMTVESPVDPKLGIAPLSHDVLAEVIPGSVSLGGGTSITEKGPGIYSFNWWVNGILPNGEKYWPHLSSAAYKADGKNNQAVCWIIPEYDMVFAWTESGLGNAGEKLDELIVKSIIK